MRWGLDCRGKYGGPGRDRTDDLFHAMEARSQLRHRPTCWRVLQFSRRGEVPVKPGPARKLHTGGVPGALDDFADGGYDFVGSCQLHVVAAVDEDLAAVGGELSQPGLTLLPFFLLLGCGDVLIVPKAPIGAG